MKKTNKLCRILKNPYMPYILVSVITLFMYIVYLFFNKIVPFGENTILKNDEYTQFVDFLCYYKQVLLGKESIQISWFMGLGVNFYTTFTYYLASPINIIAIFFNNSNMYICVEIITGIKILLIANCMCFYIKNVFKTNGCATIIFSLMYTFCSYVIGFIFNILWLDSIYMLPIVAYMIEKYIHKNKFIGYVITLSISLLINYYIGYMVILFSVMYFLSKYILADKVEIKKIIKFILYTFLAIGISAITILPSILQMITIVDTNTYTVPILLLSNGVLFELTNQCFNNYNLFLSDFTSKFFCGTLTTVLFTLYYLNKKIRVKEKVVFTGVILSLILPVISPFLERLWHGMTKTNGFYFRYSFITSFFLIYIGLRTFKKIKGIKLVHILFSLFILTSITAIEIFGICNIPKMKICIKLEQVFIAYAFALAFELILAFKIKYNTSKLLNIILIILVVIDISLAFKADRTYPSELYTIKEYNKNNNLVEYIKSKNTDNKTNRIEFDIDDICENLGSKYGFSTLSYFTSARDVNIISSFYNLGYNAHKKVYLWLTSKTGNFINYSLIGSKYFITQQDDYELYGIDYVEDYDNYKIYKNDNAFNMAYIVNNNFIPQENENSFEIQNEILKSFIDNNNEYLYDIRNRNEVSNINIEKEDNLEKIKIIAKKDITIYINTNKIEFVKINGIEKYKNAYNIDSKESGIRQIVSLKPKEEIVIYVKNYKENIADIYATDNEEILKVMKEMKEKNQINNIFINKNRVKIQDTDIKNGYIVFAIPYQKGWSAYINNEKTEIQNMYGTFLGIKIDKEGTYNIELKYEVPYLKMSSIISIISLIILLCCILKKREV